jgi:hypothetical protein
MKPRKLRECTHDKVMPAFDLEKSRTMTAAEVKKTYPRFTGVCPDCGYYGALYASMSHFIAGDW